MTPRAIITLPDQISVASTARPIPISVFRLVKVAGISVMGKVQFEPSFDPFYWGIEITKSQPREFFTKDFLELTDTHTLTCVSHTDLSEVPVRVNIEIAPLDHLESSLINQL